MKYHITGQVERTTRAFLDLDITVEADSQEAAEAKALDDYLDLIDHKAFRDDVPDYEVYDLCVTK